jgi:hypothetical protein
VSLVHRHQLDERTFWRWAGSQPGRPAFAGVRIVATGRATDVVCGVRAGHPGRTCLAVRLQARGARVQTVALVAPGRRAVRDRRLACPPGARSCSIGAPGP